jgi:hypothetical protein
MLARTPRACGFRKKVILCELLMVWLLSSQRKTLWVLVAIRFLVVEIGLKNPPSKGNEPSLPAGRAGSY